MRFLRARYRAIFRGDVAPARLRAYHDAFANRTTFDATPSHRSATANTPFTLDRLATVTKTAATSGSRAESFSSARRCADADVKDVHVRRDVPQAVHEDVVPL